MPSWIFKEESNREKLRRETQRRSQPRRRRVIKVVDRMLKSKREALEKSMMRAEVKKSDKIHHFKVKEAMSSVEVLKTDLQEKDSTLKL